MTKLRSNSDLSGWQLVRVDECGVPGRQPNIRATGNATFTEEEMPGSALDRSAAYSFLTLSTSYWRLDPNASYRVRVAYGTSAERPRVQSMRVGTDIVHPPMALPLGRTETWVFDVPVAADELGRLTLFFDAHELPDASGRTDTVADTAIVTRVELFSNTQPPPAILDVATVPDGGILVSLLSVPLLGPMAGQSVDIALPDGSTVNLITDAQGEAISVDPSRVAGIELGNAIVARVTVAGQVVETSVVVDQAFRAGWPALTPQPHDPVHALPLDGTWQFLLGAGQWEPVEVPGQWYQQGFDVAAGEYGRYRTTFAGPAHIGCTILRFDGVYSHARVLLNGTVIGEHEGGFTPFQFDVSSLLDEQNLVEVLVRSDSESDVISAASDYAGHPLGGITRGVRLLLLPTDHLSRLHVESGFDNGAGTARIFGTVSSADSVTVTIRIDSSAGIPLVERSLDVPASSPRFETTIELDGVLPWTAESPHQYELSARVGDGPWVVRKFGYRSVEVVGTQLVVNGSPIRLRGVERHEQDPVRGRSTLPQNWATDVELMKSANVNNVFTCHYPHAEGFLDLCDERGLWVIDESPTVWVGEHNADDPAQFLTVAMPILEMIERDFSRPSVIVWMLGDECLWGRNFWRLVSWLRHQGISIPMMFSFDIGGASSLDIASRHYPPVEFDKVLGALDRPVTFDQFAHVNCYNRRELITDPEVRDWWGVTFDPHWRAIVADERVLGGQIWAWCDDEFHVDDGRVIGYGMWGIVDTWRRPKPEWWNLKMIYSPIQVDRFTLSAGHRGELRVPVRNLYDFLDLSSVTLEWSTSNDSGSGVTSGAARAEGLAVLTLGQPLTPGDQLQLRFFDGQGALITAVGLDVEIDETLPSAPLIVSPREPVAITRDTRSHLSAPNKSEFDAFRIQVGQVEWVCDEETGLLRAGRWGRRTVVLEAPNLLLLPANATASVGPHHRNGIEPLTATCEGRRVISVDWRESDRSLSAEVDYVEAYLVYSMTIDDDGALSIDYTATPHSPIEVRQVGLVFDLPSSFSTLSWSREAHWQMYPDDHIGRPQGVAPAANKRQSVFSPTGVPSAPEWPWSLDENALGTADFRATRRNIRWTKVSDHTGVCVVVEPRERTDTRVWRAGDRTRLLVANHTSGGSEPFLSHTGQVRESHKRLDAGEPVHGRIRLRITADGLSG